MYTDRLHVSEIERCSLTIRLFGGRSGNGSVDDQLPRLPHIQKSGWLLCMATPIITA